MGLAVVSYEAAMQVLLLSLTLSYSSPPLIHPPPPLSIQGEAATKETVLEAAREDLVNLGALIVAKTGQVVLSSSPPLIFSFPPFQVVALVRQAREE